MILAAPRTRFLTHPIELSHADVRVTKALAKAIIANGGTVAPEQSGMRSPFRDHGMRVILPKGTYKVYSDEYNHTTHLPDGQRIAGEFGGARAVYLSAVPCTGTTPDTADHSGVLTYKDLTA